MLAQPLAGEVSYVSQGQLKYRSVRPMLVIPLGAAGPVFALFGKVLHAFILLYAWSQNAVLGL